jgi:hypothetical protein
MISDDNKIQIYARNCPMCDHQSGLRRIVYGLVTGPPDPAVYRLGGCCISDNAPDFTCIKCGWEGLFSEVERFE